MIIASHLIWTGYGHWLPNDPRGSSSHEIRCARIAPLGELNHGRKRIQPAGREIKEFYEAARGVLSYPLLSFDSKQIESIGDSFDEVINERGYTCYACAIMPDHIHLIIRKHRDKAEDMITCFQDASREVLQAPYGDHPIWGGPGWKVFLDSKEDVVRTVHYVEQNPVKIKLPEQHWSFVKKYDGWIPAKVTFAKPQARRMPK